MEVDKMLATGSGAAQFLGRVAGVGDIIFQLPQGRVTLDFIILIIFYVLGYSTAK